MKVCERGQAQEGSNSYVLLKRLCLCGEVEGDCNGFRLFRNKEMQ